MEDPKTIPTKTLEERQKEVYQKLSTVDVKEFIKSRNNANYVSWADAWNALLKIYPTATAKVKWFTNADGLQMPYVYDKLTGYMVFTEVTIEDKTREMWLPVMDGNNNPLKAESYTYETKTGKVVTVDACDMFDINKALMRCLVKNIGAFGLGLYVYRGEDLPQQVVVLCTAEQIREMGELGVKVAGVLRKFNKATLEDLTYEEAEYVINAKKKAIKGE